MNVRYCECATALFHHDNENAPDRQHKSPTLRAFQHSVTIRVILVAYFYGRPGTGLFPVSMMCWRWLSVSVRVFTLLVACSTLFTLQVFGLPTHRDRKR